MTTHDMREVRDPSRDWSPCWYPIGGMMVYLHNAEAARAEAKKHEQRADVLAEVSLMCHRAKHRRLEHELDERRKYHQACAQEADSLAAQIENRELREKLQACEMERRKEILREMQAEKTPPAP